MRRQRNPTRPKYHDNIRRDSPRIHFPVTDTQSKGQASVSYNQFSDCRSPCPWIGLAVVPLSELDEHRVPKHAITKIYLQIPPPAQQLQHTACYGSVRSASCTQVQPLTRETLHTDKWKDTRHNVFSFSKDICNVPCQALHVHVCRCAYMGTLSTQQQRSIPRPFKCSISTSESLTRSEVNRIRCKYYHILVAFHTCIQAMFVSRNLGL